MDQVEKSLHSSTAVRPFTYHAPQSRARRASPAHPRHALAGKGDRRGFFAGRAARDGPGARALLGDGIRLAQGRGEARRPAAVHHRDRRAGHPLHPRPFEARERAADHHHARMAGLDHRADEDHRPAHQSDGAWRQSVGRLPRRDSVDARLRVLGQADRDRLGPRAHRARLGRADEAPRVHAIRRARRRLGRDHHGGDGDAGPRN